MVLLEFAGCIAFIVSGQQVGLFAVGAVFSAQFFVLTLLSRRVIGPISEDEELRTRISLALKEVCSRARCEIPRVSLRRTNVPVGVAPIRGYVRLQISPDLVEVLDDRALRAILAHEIAHLTQGDVKRFLMRARLSMLFLYVVWLLVYWKLGTGAGGIALFALVVFIVPCLRILSLATSAQNQPREVRADIDGAILVSDPQGMIRGLQAVYDLSGQLRQRLYPRRASKWALFPWSIRARSHPSLEARINILNAFEVSDNRGAQTK